MRERYSDDPARPRLATQLTTAFDDMKKPWDSKAYDTDGNDEDPLVASIAGDIDRAAAVGSALQAKTAESGDAATKHAGSTYSSTRSLLIVFLIIGLAAAAALGVLLVRNIVPRVR